MVKLLSTGKVRSVGVSSQFPCRRHPDYSLTCPQDFNIRRLKDLLQKSGTVPVVNQIEAHPYLQQTALFKFCKENNILIEAYSPLGNNQTGESRTIDDAKVQDLAKKLGKDAGQLLASWGVQRGTVVLPKSVTESRIGSNFQGWFTFVFQWIEWHVTDTSSQISRFLRM